MKRKLSLLSIAFFFILSTSIINVFAQEDLKNKSVQEKPKAQSGRNPRMVFISLNTGMMIYKSEISWTESTFSPDTETKYSEIYKWEQTRIAMELGMMELPYMGMGWNSYLSLGYIFTDKFSVSGNEKKDFKQPGYEIEYSIGFGYSIKKKFYPYAGFGLNLFYQPDGEIDGKSIKTTGGFRSDIPLTVGMYIFIGKLVISPRLSYYKLQIGNLKTSWASTSFVAYSMTDAKVKSGTLFSLSVGYRFK